MTADLGPAATPRPIPTPGDRMRDARQPGPTFATYLDRHERDQLDARAATAEQERDEAVDDLRDTRADLKHKNDILQATATALGMLGGDLIDDIPAVAARLRAERDEALDARDVLRHQLDRTLADLARVRAEVEEGSVEIAIRDQIAADALRWAANKIDPGPRASRQQPLDEQHDITMCANRGTATNLRLWADQVLRGYIEPRPSGSTPPGLGSPADRAQDEPAELPAWVLELVRGLDRYEAEHPTLYRYMGVNQYEPWPCPAPLLGLVPVEVRRLAGIEG